jgi:hypothetical protein
MDEYRRRFAEWRENVDPAALQELNRIRVAKGRNRIHGPRRPMTGYNRYVYEYTYRVAVLSKVPAFSYTYMMSTQRQKMSNIISRPPLDAPQVNGGQ